MRVIDRADPPPRPRFAGKLHRYRVEVRRVWDDNGSWTPIWGGGYRSLSRARRVMRRRTRGTSWSARVVDTEAQGDP